MKKNEQNDFSCFFCKSKQSLYAITSEINELIFQLQLNLDIIFKEYDKQKDKMRAMYFIEFYKIVSGFDFIELKKMISIVGIDIDSTEFYKGDYKEMIDSKLLEHEVETSISVYNETVVENNSIEYKALKDNFFSK